MVKESIAAIQTRKIKSPNNFVGSTILTVLNEKNLPSFIRQYDLSLSKQIACNLDSVVRMAAVSINSAVCFTNYT